MKWISDNNLKKYFNINTGLVGIFPSNAFVELTEYTFPVFDIEGKYAGYVNVRDFIKNRITQEKRNRTELVRSVWNAVIELTENGETASIGSIRCKTSIEYPEIYLSWMVRHGDLVESGKNEYTCKNKENKEICITERVFILRDAFIKLSKLNTRIHIKQVEAASGLTDINTELDFLKRRGYLIQANPEEFIWV